uniref:Uncharacterized protein n=1 Tax=Kalanchoe fedtschenkoi TaxID=63787 RepID=A0A7N0T6T6_KALFE
MSYNDQVQGGDGRGSDDDELNEGEGDSQSVVACGMGTNISATTGERMDEDKWCNLCHSSNWNSVTAMLDHQASAHLKYEKSLKRCDKCKRYFPGKLQLQDHRQNVRCPVINYPSSSKKGNKK